MMPNQPYSPSPPVPQSPVPYPPQHPGSGSPMGRVILAERSLGRFQLSAGTEPLRAGVTAVYSRADGSVVALGRPLKLGEAATKGYRNRYDVGIANHEYEFNIANELPSREDVFRFYARVQFGFRVHDPAQVVRTRVQDGFQLARWRLLDAMRLISRKYMTEDCARANDEINHVLGSRPQVFEEGITVYRFAAFLSLDEQTQEALRRRRATDHEILQAQKVAELERIKAAHQWELEQDRMTAVRQAMQGDHGLLALHMARHPDDTHKVLELVVNSREGDRKERLDLLRTMAENNMIQGVDIAEIRDENLRQILFAVRSDPLQALQIAAETPALPQPSPPVLESTTGIPLPPIAVDDPGDTGATAAG